MEPPQELIARAAPIRVLAAGLTVGLLGLVSGALQEQPDMRLVGVVEDGVSVLLAAGEGVDVVVLGAARVAPPPGICSHLLGEYPDLKVVVLALDGRAAAVYSMGLRAHQLDTVSPAELITSIRQAHTLNPMT